MKLRHMTIALIALLLVGLAAWAVAQDAGYATGTNYTAPGGANTVIQGTLTINSGATVSVNNGATWSNSADWTMENGEVLGNTAANTVSILYNGTAAELGEVEINSASTSGTMADNDYYRHSWWADNSSTTNTEFGYMDFTITDVTGGTEDALFEWGVETAGTLAAEMRLDGAAVFPVTDEGLDVGKAAQEFRNGYFDGTLTADVLEVGTRTLALATGTINNSTSSTTVAVSGTDSNDIAFVTLNTLCGTYITATVPGTNQVVVTTAANVNTTATISLQVWQD